MATLRASAFHGAWLALALAGGACGRVGYGSAEREEPAPLVPEGTLQSSQHDLCARPGGGFAAAIARMAPGAEGPELALVETDASGVILTGPVAVESVARWPIRLQIFASGDAYHLAYQLGGSNDLHVRRVGAGGEILASERIAGRRQAHAAAAGGGLAVAFTLQDAMSRWQVHVVRLDEAGVERGAPVPVEASAGHQLHPRIGSSGDRLGVLFRDDATSPSPARLAVLAPDLSLVAPSVPMAERPASTHVARAVAADGAGGFLAAWEEGSANRIERFDAGGARVWSAPALLPPNRRESQDFALAVSGGRVLVFWQSDDETNHAGVSGAWLDLEEGGGPEGRVRLTPPAASFCCPAAAAGPAGAAVAVYGGYRARLGSFLRVWSP